MDVLADNGRYVFAEDGAALRFFERNIPPTWLVFVPGLVAVVTALNGLVQLALGQVGVGVVLAVFGGLAAVASWQVLARRRAIRATALEPDAAVVVLDRERGALLDGAGTMLAPLDVVRLEMPMQLTSSARALRVSWPGGSVVVFRGDPLSFGASIAGPLRALRERGFAVA